MAAKGEHSEGDEGVGDLNPNVVRAMSLILVFIDSTRPLERPCSIAARIAVRCLVIDFWSLTNVGILQRRAQSTHCLGLRQLRRRGI